MIVGRAEVARGIRMDLAQLVVFSFQSKRSESVNSLSELAAGVLWRLRVQRSQCNFDHMKIADWDLRCSKCRSEWR